MARKQIEKEVEEWLEGDEETALIELQDVADETLQFCIGENEQKFSITYPKGYPKSTDNFFVFAEDAVLGEWQEGLNEFAEKKGTKLKITELLSKAAETYLEKFGDGDEEDEMEDEDDMLGLDTSAKVEKPKKSAAESEIDSKEFLEIGSASATMRLIKDLKTITKSNPQEMGFSAAPAIEKNSGLENLYHWEVKLFGFEPKSDLAKDMAKYSSKSGQDYILLELRFSKDYPFQPPFVRVVSPRFQFRTGHVTLGGSICMELLTNSGWNSSV